MLRTLSLGRSAPDDRQDLQTEDVKPGRDSEIVLRTLLDDLRVDVNGLLIMSIGTFCSALVIGRNRLILGFERFGPFEHLLEKMVLAGQSFACIVDG